MSSHRALSVIFLFFFRLSEPFANLLTNHMETMRTEMLLCGIYIHIRTVDIRFVYVINYLAGTVFFAFLIFNRYPQLSSCVHMNLYKLNRNLRITRFLLLAAAGWLAGKSVHFI